MVTCPTGPVPAWLLPHVAGKRSQDRNIMIRNVAVAVNPRVGAAKMRDEDVGRPSRRAGDRGPRALRIILHRSFFILHPSSFSISPIRRLFALPQSEQNEQKSTFYFSFLSVLNHCYVFIFSHRRHAAAEIPPEKLRSPLVWLPVVRRLEVPGFRPYSARFPPPVLISGGVRLQGRNLVSRFSMICAAINAGVPVVAYSAPLDAALLRGLILIPVVCIFFDAALTIPIYINAYFWILSGLSGPNCKIILRRRRNSPTRGADDCLESSHP
jgi:hypothetical protein